MGLSWSASGQGGSYSVVLKVPSSFVFQKLVVDFNAGSANLSGLKATQLEVYLHQQGIQMFTDCGNFAEINSNHLG